MLSNEGGNPKSRWVLSKDNSQFEPGVLLSGVSLANCTEEELGCYNFSRTVTVLADLNRLAARCSFIKVLPAGGGSSGHL